MPQPNLRKGYVMKSSHGTRSVYAVWLMILRPVALVVLTLLGWLLPNRGKRILFSVSLYTHLNRVDPDGMDSDNLNEYLADINTLFQLTTTGNQALHMPVMLHQFIWNRIDLPDDISLTKFTVQNNCEALLRRIPYWLRYDCHVMRDDVMIIVRRSAGQYLKLNHQ